MLHQHAPRISYLKSIQTFDVHFEAVHTQPFLLQCRIKVRLNRDVHVLYSIRRPSFTDSPERSDFSPVLMAMDQSIYCKSNKSARLLVQMCRLTIAT